MNITTSKEGFVKLHRAILDSDLVRDHSAFRLFSILLLLAHYEDNNGSIRFSGKQLYLKRGQLAISRQELSDIVLLPPSTIRNTLARLKEDKRVDIKTDKHISIITICKWSHYQPTKGQAKGQDDGQPLDNHWTTTGQPTPVSEELKNIRTKEIEDCYEAICTIFKARALATNRRLEIIKEALNKGRTSNQIVQGAKILYKQKGVNSYWEGKSPTTMLDVFLGVSMGKTTLDGRLTRIDGYISQALEDSGTTPNSRGFA